MYFLGVPLLFILESSREGAGGVFFFATSVFSKPLAGTWHEVRIEPQEEHVPVFLRRKLYRYGSDGTGIKLKLSSPVR